MPAPLKNAFDRPSISRLAANMKRAWSPFNKDAFVAQAMAGLHDLELKERVAHVAEVLALTLPNPYKEAVAIVVRASKNWEADKEDPFRGFAAWPLFHFIEHHGTGDFKTSMAALRSITHLFTAEFAIRPFIAQYPKKAFAELAHWTADESEHVRRLVSEGTRPRLPWASQLSALIQDPKPIIPLLEELVDDPALYVRRSVANNLNDIAKDHPDFVIDLCMRWTELPSEHRKWVIARATRSLVKEGHPRVWGLLGFTDKPRISTSDIVLDMKKINIGGKVTFEFAVTSKSKSTQRLAIDYAVHYTKANGKRRPKVFKLKVLDLLPGESIEFSKAHSFRELSTRKHYPGPHSIEVLINGTSRTQADFTLLK